MAVRPGPDRHPRSCGFYREQQDCAVFGFDEDHFDADSLDADIRTLYNARPVRATWTERAAQRRTLARAHPLYEQALS